MRARVKYHVIYHHRTGYPMYIMCKFFGLSRSGYYSFLQWQARPVHDAELAGLSREHQAHCNRGELGFAAYSPSRSQSLFYDVDYESLCVINEKSRDIKTLPGDFSQRGGQTSTQEGCKGGGIGVAKENQAATLASASLLLAKE